MAKHKESGQDDKKRAKNEKVQALFDNIEAGVTSLVTSEDWVKWLKFIRRFHKYSWGNQLLIFTQAPTATLCAGFKTWQKNGRQVQKGSKGIRILAPLVRKDKEKDESYIAGFRSAAVFDIAQTEGEPVPAEPKVSWSLDGGGEAEKKLTERFTAVATALGFHLQYVPDYMALGSCSFAGEPTITLRAGLGPLEEVATLTHEIGHALLHGPEREEKPDTKVSEVEAESFAYAVLAHYGIDIGKSSFAYVTTWSGGDLDTVRSVVEQVSKALKAFAAAEEQTDEREAA